MYFGFCFWLGHFDGNPRFGQLGVKWRWDQGASWALTAANYDTPQGSVWSAQERGKQRRAGIRVPSGSGVKVAVCKFLLAHPFCAYYGSRRHLLPRQLRWLPHCLDVTLALWPRWMPHSNLEHTLLWPCDLRRQWWRLLH